MKKTIIGVIALSFIGSLYNIRDNNTKLNCPSNSIIRKDSIDKAKDGRNIENLGASNASWVNKTQFASDFPNIARQTNSMGTEL